MQEKLLAAAREAVQEIASTMLFMEITPMASGPGSGVVSTDMSAVVGYSGALKGSVRLAGPTDSALKLAAGLMGEEMTEMNDDANDAFAEMSNMIAGGIQTRVAPDIGQINLTPPVVISGNSHRVSGKSGEICIHQCFETDGAKFFVEIMYLVQDH